MFFNLLAQSDNVTQTLKFGTQLPLWAYCSIIALILLWVYNCYKREASSRSRVAKFVLIFIRMIIFLLLLLILSEPIWEEQYNEVKKSNLIFLIDSSQSMNAKDRYDNKEEREKLEEALSTSDLKLSETSRIEIVSRILEKSQRIEELEKDCKLHFYKFDTVLNKLSSPSSLLEAKGSKTNIYDHVAKAIDAMQGRTIEGIFLFTDGQHNTGRMRWQDAASYAKKKADNEMAPIPIYTVGMGSQAKKKDIILTGVEAPEIALVDDKVPFEFEIKHIGFEGAKIPVYLKWGESILAEEEVTLGAQGEKQRFVISHTFRIADDYNVSVVIPSQLNEYSIENNVRHHNIKIIQQKLKVLYLEGLPRWEYRYLKNALIRDDTILTNTWLFSADESFPQDKSKKAPEIRGFPSKEELFKYHCVIVGDISLEDITLRDQRNLAEYVRDNGGGVIFIAGTRHNPKNYWDTEISPLLPVIVEGDAGEGSFTEPRRLRITPEGKRHPIMRLLPNTDENIHLWENEREGIANFYWYYIIEKAKPGATVLALEKNQRTPLFVTQFYGKGKTFFTALDSSWRWRKFYGDRYFYRFWGQVIRHISMGMLLGTGRQYYLRVDNPQYVIGDMVNVVLRVVDNTKQSPVDQKEWKVFYSTPSKKTKEKILKAVPSEPGTYEGSLIATEIGSYKIWLKAEGKEISTMFYVEAPVAESGKTELNEEPLKKLAQETQGAYLKPYQLEETLKTLNPVQERIPIKIHPKPLFDKDWVVWLFLAIIALYTIEWIVRKMFRML